jgi:hypothetical protein
MTMENKLDIIENNGYATAKLTGVRRPESLLEAASKTTAFCKERGISHLLIDIRGMSGELDTLETYDVAGQELPNQPNARRLIRSVILDHPENLERIRFFETVAVNRGLMVKVFDDEDAAVRWLLADQPDRIEKDDRA